MAGVGNIILLTLQEVEIAERCRVSIQDCLSQLGGPQFNSCHFHVHCIGRNKLMSRDGDEMLTRWDFINRRLVERLKETCSPDHTPPRRRTYFLYLSDKDEGSSFYRFVSMSTNNETINKNRFQHKRINLTFYSAT
jgi:hypothetical protein